MTPDTPGARDTVSAEALGRLDNARLEALLRLSHVTAARLDEVASFTMEQAVRLTRSELGYVAFADEDETVLTRHAWSSGAMRECRTREVPRTYVVAETGLWGEPIRQRRTVVTDDGAAPSPWKKGTPDGHVEIRRHMGVPISDGERIVIVAGVANKADDYDAGDIRRIALLMSGMWPILRPTRKGRSSRSGCRRPRSWSRSAAWPAAWRTSSTTRCRRSWATRHCSSKDCRAAARRGRASRRSSGRPSAPRT